MVCQVKSSDAVMTSLPSGLHAAVMTLLSCPRRTGGSPVPSAFHTRTVLSADDVTMR